jgi:hemolysin III
MTTRPVGLPGHEHDHAPRGAVETGLGHTVEHLADNLVDLAEETAAAVRDRLAVVKPKLRGWLHLAAAPVALIAGLVLVLVSDTTAGRVGAGVFVGAAAVQYAVSAAYNIGSYGSRTTLMLRRADHSTIFLLIAGSYTPFALVLLAGQARITLLALAWGGAAAGIVFKVLFPHTHRLISVLPYIGLGWLAVFFLPDFAATASTATLLLLITGVLLYSAGVVVYGLRRPNPSVTWFGFHELFHVATLLAFGAHFTAVAIAVT